MQMLGGPISFKLIFKHANKVMLGCCSDVEMFERPPKLLVVFLLSTKNAI